MAIAWISFLVLSPNFFVKEIMFSLATIVEKLLQVDMTTWSKIRSSYERVKVKVDLLDEFCKHINIGARNQKTGEVKEKWVKIN